jgi:hypothetical protein
MKKILSEEEVRVPADSNSPSEDDYEFLKFRVHAEECGLSGSEPDWDTAQAEWARLSTGEKIEAHRGLSARKGTDDSALKSLPKNYLERKMWQRQVHQQQQQYKAMSVGSEPLGEYRPDWWDGVTYPETCSGRLNGDG